MNANVNCACANIRAERAESELDRAQQQIAVLKNQLRESGELCDGLRIENKKLRIIALEANVCQLRSENQLADYLLNDSETHAMSPAIARQVAHVMSIPL